jgi:hypothetical protein
MDEGVFAKIFSAATGVWALVCLAAVALFKSWPHIMGRFNERLRDTAAEKAGDWDRIRSERDVAREERDLVRDRWAECQAELNAERAAHMKLKAYHDGIGEARQDAARIVAAERLLDAAKKANGGDK